MRFPTANKKPKGAWGRFLGAMGGFPGGVPESRPLMGFCKESPSAPTNFGGSAPTNFARKPGKNRKICGKNLRAISGHHRNETSGQTCGQISGQFLGFWNPAPVRKNQWLASSACQTKEDMNKVWCTPAVGHPLPKSPGKRRGFRVEGSWEVDTLGTSEQAPPGRHKSTESWWNPPDQDWDSLGAACMSLSYEGYVFLFCGEVCGNIFSAQISNLRVCQKTAAKVFPDFRW